MQVLAINGTQVSVQGIKELAPGISIQQATLKTKKNGLDEVYFTVNGTSYLAYGDALDLKELSRNKIASITYNGMNGNVVAYEDEINSVGEGIKKGALDGLKKTKDAVFGAISNTVTSVGPTGVLLAGGALGLTGIALWRGGLATGVGAAATVGAASPLGSLIGDILKNGSIGALKVISVAGAIGFGITAVAGAIGGISEAASSEKDYSTIAAVTKDGNAGGPPAATFFNNPSYYTPQQPIDNTPVNNEPVLNAPVFTRPIMGSVGSLVAPQYLNSRY